VERFHARMPVSVALHNLYGPTEAAVDVSHWTCDRPAGDRVPIGRPVWNTQLHVLDENLRPMPIGVPGELYIGGIQVGRGYLNRPALTAGRFVPDPCSRSGGRLYRTGDRARWRADGTLEYFGRFDDQVKIRGLRIELGEIEAALRQFAGVSDCAVIVREQAAGDKSLVAYTVADSRLDPEQLRAHLRRTVPEYMVPSAFVALDRLPLTPNGKLNRQALPAPDFAQADLEIRGPRNFVEAQLMQIWEALLGVEVRSPLQSFFELGGHSLMAVRLFARIRQCLACDLPLSTLFAGATVRQLADAILEHGRSTPAPPSTIVPLQSRGSQPPLFCVHPGDRRVICYVHLVRHLGVEQPIFGLEDLGVDLARPVTQIAAEYVAAIRSVRPEGPYHLLGWSFGGLIAYEIARQLERQGQDVAFLGLMDTVEPVSARGWIADDLDLLINASHDLATQAGRRVSIARPELEPLGLDERFARVLDELHAQGVAESFGHDELRDYYDLLKARVQSIHGYVPGPFSGTVTLFRASVNDVDRDPFFSAWTGQERRTLGWCRVSSDVSVHPVPGAHSTIAREPNVRVLARDLLELLAAAGRSEARRLPVGA
jgi:thioesterase domain-containing protein/acyl carrier protein